MTTFADDNSYPYQTVAYIEARWGTTWASGSGVLVGNNDVLTANHVVYNAALGGLADEIDIYFSYSPSGYDTPYHPAQEQYFPQADPDGGSMIVPGDGITGSYTGSEEDIALLSLSSAVGNIYGWMGMDGSFSSGDANVTGYPAVYGFNLTNDSGYVWKDPVDNIIHTGNLDINHGNSGGPVWYDTGSGPYVIGVVSTAYVSCSLSGHIDWLIDSISDDDKFIVDDGHVGSIEYGTSGNDTFVESTAYGSYVGNGGTDAITFSGVRSQYDVGVALGGTGTVELNATGHIWSLSSIERLDFQDGTLAFDNDAAEGYRLYRAAFDRAPDTSGLSYWVNQLDDGNSLHNVAQSFIGSEEFHGLYGATPSHQDLVQLLYQNVLDRAPDAGGLSYWTAQLNSGMSEADLLVAFSESAENQANVVGAIDHGIWLA